MKRIALAAAAAIAMSAAAYTASPADREITLTGCVVKGDGGYLLMNADPGGPAFPSTSYSDLASPAGTTGVVSAGRVFYWLADDDHLKDHGGQRVQITGKLDDHLDLGKVEVERDNGLVELKFKVDDRKVKVKVPETSSMVGTSGVSDKESESEFIVRKVDVKSVKMLASTCQ
jgi:hypothetical protein